MNDLQAAATFLTRVPVHRASAADDAPSMSRAVPWFAVVGLILGAVQAVLFVGLLEVMPALPAAALAVAALALVTGAFHHDGLADMADAFGGGWTVEQRLDIMKDSRLGTYGTVTLVLALIVEVSTIAAIGELGAAIAASALIIAHSLSRSIAAALMLVAKPVQGAGLAANYVAELSRPAVLISAGVTIVIALVLLQLAAVAAVIGAYVAGGLVVALAMRKIGGITGDVLGAIQQMAKLAALVAIVITAA